MQNGKQTNSKGLKLLLAGLLCLSMSSQAVLMTGCSSLTGEDEYDKALEQANRNLEISKENTRRQQEKLEQMQQDFAPFMSND